MKSAHRSGQPSMRSPFRSGRAFFERKRPRSRRLSAYMALRGGLALSAARPMTTRTKRHLFPAAIESRDDLLSVFAGGEKPRERWRIGTEHEKFVYR